MSSEMFNLVASIVLAFGGIAISIICSLHPRIRKEKLNNAHSELLGLYRDIQEFLKEEKAYMEETGKSKIAIRKSLSISDKCAPSHVEARIRTLESQVK
ncbi:MAG: hypothetical protein IJL58_04055 [Bacteroidales bacterium]|nr:hypothetical protein [Bacteroidales bacterium]